MFYEIISDDCVQYFKLWNVLWLEVMPAFIIASYEPYKVACFTRSKAMTVHSITSYILSKTTKIYSSQNLCSAQDLKNFFFPKPLIHHQRISLLCALQIPDFTRLKAITLFVPALHTLFQQDYCLLPMTSSIGSYRPCRPCSTQQDYCIQQQQSTKRS